MRIGILAGTGRSLILFRIPLLKALTKQGCTVFAYIPPSSPDVIAELKSLGVVVRIVTFQPDSLNPLQDLRYQLQLRQGFEFDDLAAVLAYTAKPVVYGIPAAHAASVPVWVPMITGL